MSKVVTVHDMGEKVESREKHVSERGLLVELFKYQHAGFWGDDVHQVNLFTVEPGWTKGGHKHPNTDETWIIVVGTGVMRLEYPCGLKVEMEYCTTRNEDDALVVSLPAGTGHDITADTFTLVVYDTDRLYDPDDRDEEPWEWEA